MGDVPNVLLRPLSLDIFCPYTDPDHIIAQGIFIKKHKKDSM